MRRCGWGRGLQKRYALSLHAIQTCYFGHNYLILTEAFGTFLFVFIFLLDSSFFFFFFCFFVCLFCFAFF